MKRFFGQIARALWLAIGAGVAYGLLARVFYYAQALEPLFVVMSVGFIFLMPLALGYITVSLAPPRPWWQRMLLPWIPGVLLVGTALLVGWEGSLCIVMALPIFLVMGSLGGLVAGWIGQGTRGTTQLSALIFIALLPYLVTPLELRSRPPTQIRSVATAIVIDAPAATVWEQIIRVPAIQPDELGVTPVNLMGIPRPVEATLSHEGIGGVRHATFEHGVTFVETITAWEPQRGLAFSIAAQAETMTSPDLNGQIVVGGEFFDALDGRYTIEPRGPDQVVLHLTSDHRLATRFNPYAGLWTDFIMRSTQNNILQVIKARCEAAPQPESTL
ncbi:MAG: hypothetical protein KDD78_13385 [Caldilineaceae bacterium]|nr:hypothetical protein [Caldilineaceae bacterium]